MADDPLTRRPDDLKPPTCYLPKLRKSYTHSHHTTPETQNAHFGQVNFSLFSKSMRSGRVAAGDYLWTQRGALTIYQEASPRSESGSR